LIPIRSALGRIAGHDEKRSVTTILNFDPDSFCLTGTVQVVAIAK